MKQLKLNKMGIVNKKLHTNNNQEMWAYFAPDGWVQVRSIAETKELCREMIAEREYHPVSGLKTTYKDYEEAGYTMHKVLFDLQVIANPKP